MRGLLISPALCLAACLVRIPLPESTRAVIVIDDQKQDPPLDPEAIAKVLEAEQFSLRRAADYYADTAATSFCTISNHAAYPPVAPISLPRGRSNTAQPFYRSLPKHQRRRGRR